MASGLYNKGVYTIAVQTVFNWSSTNIRVLLLKTGAPAFAKTHNFVSDVISGGFEVTVGGYARGTLGSPTVTEDDTNMRCVFDGADQAFGALSTGETIIAAVVYIYNAADAAAPVICYSDFTDTPTNGSTFTVQWHTDGIWYTQH